MTEPLWDQIMAVVNYQAEDESLWFQAHTAPEADLQQALRLLHQTIEHSAPAAAPVPPSPDTALLEALREAEDALAWYADDGKAVAKGALATVQAAIAKAEGR